MLRTLPRLPRSGGIAVWTRSFFGGAKAADPAAAQAAAPASDAADASSAVFKFTAFKTHLISGPESHETTTTANEMRSYFADMYRMRRMEMELDSMYQRSLVRGFCHLYNGQEAVAVGMEAAITREDCIITAYRNHCQQLGRGGTVKSIMAELTGRYAGCSKGKGGSMHLYLKENNYYGGNGIVGAQAPLGAGLAFAQKYAGKKAVSISMFGDGAANQGQLYEALNMSALWRLPAIFVCENNQYGMGTSTLRAAASKDFYTRGHYIPGLCIDGMDVLAVREGMKFAKQFALEEGPIYVEMDTYRYKGHSISDQGLSYRTADEIKGIQKGRDPIDLVKRRLIENGWATAEELKAQEKAIRKEIDAAVTFAESSPQPPEQELFADVYTGEPPRMRGTLNTNGNMP